MLMSMFTYVLLAAGAAFAVFRTVRFVKWKRSGLTPEQIDRELLQLLNQEVRHE
ncbi:hypothetical protein ACFQI7_09450 [Paenibacillus allorhizosphaerae]|uniref:DUF4083 domain-containing protein n=1 Tax=Paenibacillus allorhizosphaerae TaxID=2849866 RepID=A0ABM8VIJ7_9BACL|nr:hypothetical protein [Paenibacillus allorhizosphaerae]CAG7644255.1 hypothetical protein PAECIP111802_03201 [Paenibacillus allorhizosphaerae]